MTREEAFARVSTLLRKRGEGLDTAHRYAGASIAALEALGLIAFDDEAQNEVNAGAIRAMSDTLRSPHVNLSTSHAAGRVLDALRLGGFKVVRV